MQPWVRDLGCTHNIPQNVDSSALQITRREVPGTRRLRAISSIGIDLPAGLFVDLFKGFGFAWTKLQTNQQLTAHR
jgi:hypothetical protein